MKRDAADVIRDQGAPALLALEARAEDFPAPINGASAAHTGRVEERPTAEPVLVRLSDVRPEPIRWLWSGRIPMGKLTLISGDPGLGKSLITLDVAARVTRGLDWPDGAAGANPGAVVILTAEDDLADTVRPRLDAASADPSRVIALQAIRVGDRQRLPDLGADLRHLEGAIDLASRDVPCRLVVVDPISAYLGGKDDHSNGDIRGLLTPLAELAGRCGVAMVAVTHLRKSAGKAIYRSMGSLAFAAAARAVLGVTKDPGSKDRRLVLPLKSNLAPDTDGLAYTVAAVDGVPVLVWEPDPVRVDVEAAMGAESVPMDREALAVAEAVDWLREFLASGPRPVKDVEAEAQDAGISRASLRRARGELGARARREGYGSDGRWMLHLSPDARERAV